MNELLNTRQAIRYVAGSAIVNVCGVLAGNCPPAHEMHGNTDYNTLANELLDVQAHMRRGECDELILVVDSIGGNSQGLPEIAQLIDDMQEQGLSTVAYVKGNACSAAYYLACQCACVYATTSARVGSIGCYIQLPAPKDGATVFISEGAPLKNPQPPYSDAAKAYYQEMVDAHAREFRHVVQAARGLSDEAQERAFSGATFNAQDAQALGLIDGIIPYTALINI